MIKKKKNTVFEVLKIIDKYKAESEDKEWAIKYHVTHMN